MGAVGTEVRILRQKTSDDLSRQFEQIQQILEVLVRWRGGCCSCAFHEQQLKLGNLHLNLLIAQVGLLESCFDLAVAAGQFFQLLKELTFKSHWIQLNSLFRTPEAPLDLPERLKRH